MVIEQNLDLPDPWLASFSDTRHTNSAISLLSSTSGQRSLKNSEVSLVANPLKNHQKDDQKPSPRWTEDPGIRWGWVMSLSFHLSSLKFSLSFFPHGLSYLPHPVPITWILFEPLLAFSATLPKLALIFPYLLIMLPQSIYKLFEVLTALSHQGSERSGSQALDDSLFIDIYSDGKWSLLKGTQSKDIGFIF